MRISLLDFINQSQRLNQDMNESYVVEMSLDESEFNSMGDIYVGLLAVLGFIFVLSLLLNASSILTIISMHNYTPTNLLILNLAVSDFVYSLSIPMYSIHFYYHKWLFGLYACRFFFATEMAGMISSILTVSLLSVERYFNVTQLGKKKPTLPARLLNNKSCIKISILIVWSLATLFVVPFLHSISFENDESAPLECSSDWSDSIYRVFFILKFLFLFILPYVAIWSSSVKLLLFLKDWRQRARSRSNSLSVKRLSRVQTPSLKRKFAQAIRYTKQTNNDSPTEPNNPVFPDTVEPPSPRHERVTFNFNPPTTTTSGRTDSKATIESSLNRNRRISSVLLRPSYFDTVQDKVTRLVMTIVLVFLIQWSPLWLFQFFLTFNSDDYAIPNIQLINLIINIVSYSNTCVNPILFLFLSHNFKFFVTSKVLSSWRRRASSYV